MSQMKRTKNSNNRRKAHAGPKQHRWKRRKEKQSVQAGLHAPRVGSNGRKVKSKSKRYEAPAEFKWRP